MSHRATNNEGDRSYPPGAKRPEDRGRTAAHPGEIPKLGWKDIILRLKAEIAKDNLTVVAAGVAFFGFLALFPALIAIFSIYGIVADPSQVEQQIAGLAEVLPQNVQSLLGEQMSQLASQTSDTLGWGVAIGILGAIWSANKGTKAMIMALNIAYDEDETRGFLKLTVISLGLTIMLVLGMLLALSAIIVLPAAFAIVGLGRVAEIAIGLLRWPLLLFVGVLLLAALYKMAPDRKDAEWKWFTPGAVLSTIVWLVASVLFSWFVSNFGSFADTYGSLAAVVLLLLWIYVSAHIILIGAELNGEMEHQTKVDTTTGAPQPMGERGAYKADTLGESPGKENTR